MAYRVVIVLAMFGCGRIGFEARGDSVDTMMTSDSTGGPNGSLQLGITSQQGYVVLGDAAPLRLDAFTIEMWIRREGDGIEASSGNPPEALNPARPLVTKGRGEGDMDPTRDINYFIGLAPDRGYVLGGDFEEGPAGPNPSDNHVVRGVTPIEIGRWYHVAATYDLSAWRLFVDGRIDVELVLGAIPVASESQTQVVIGGASDSSGDVNGAFDGSIDELRFWSRARSEAEISASKSIRITSAPDLRARFGFDEGAGRQVIDSVTGIVGQIEPAGAMYKWSTTGAPLE